MSERVARLTPRQREVVRLFSLGCSVAEIGVILDLAPATVDNHKTSAHHRLGVDKMALLTRVAIEYGISPIGDKLTPKEKRLWKSALGPQRRQ